MGAFQPQARQTGGSVRGALPHPYSPSTPSQVRLRHPGFPALQRLCGRTSSSLCSEGATEVSPDETPFSTESEDVGR